MSDTPESTTDVYMVHTISGTRDGAPWPARGEVLTCADAEAADLLAAGIAATEPPPVKSGPLTTDDLGAESADVAPAETAAQNRKGRGRS